MSTKITYIEGDAITNGARWCNAYGTPRLAKDMLEQLTAMQARIEKLEIGLAGDYCPSCTWRGNVTLVHGVCPYCEVDWVELKIKENEAE